MHRKHAIDPHLYQLLLWQGLTPIHTDNPIDNQLDSYPDNLQPLFHAQQNIGWDQLYYGQIAVSWARYMVQSSIHLW